jgi:hypothetical protein
VSSLAKYLPTNSAQENILFHLSLSQGGTTDLAIFHCSSKNAAGRTIFLSSLPHLGPSSFVSPEFSSLSPGSANLNCTHVAMLKSITAAAPLGP